MSEEEEADGKDADSDNDDSSSCCELFIAAAAGMLNNEIDMHEIAISSAAVLGMDLAIVFLLYCSMEDSLHLWMRNDGTSNSAVPQVDCYGLDTDQVS